MVRALIHDTKKLSLPCLVSLYFPFQGVEWGILWGERQITSYLQSLLGVILMQNLRSLSNANSAVFRIIKLY